MLTNAYRYEEVRITQVEHLVFSRFGVDKEATENLYKEIDEKIDAYASGNLEYAAEVISLLWKFSRKRGTIPLAPENSIPISPPSPFRSCSPDTLTHISRVKTALIKSIREGVFADRKYWARHSRSGRVLRPVYLSSIVADRRLPDIETCKWLDPASPGCVDSWVWQ